MMLVAHGVPRRIARCATSFGRTRALFGAIVALLPGYLACEPSEPPKNAGDVATVEVPPVKAEPEKPAAEAPRDEPKAPDVPAPRADVPVAPPPDGSIPGPDVPSGGTARVVGAAQAPSLVTFAASEAQGMAPAGSLLAASFQQGQTMDATLTLMPGRCYTVLAVGTPGVQQIDITLTIMVGQIIPLPPATLAQGQGSGSAALGGKGNCYKYPLPLAIPATVTVKVTNGAGTVGVQVYAK